MFTLLAFLFPTVMVFYFAFAMARAGVLVGKVVLDIGLACLNHWPLFALMLRVKDPARIPGSSRPHPIMELTPQEGSDSN